MREYDMSKFIEELEGIQQALIEFNQRYKPAEGSKPNGGNNSGSTVYAPQYGEDVIDRLLLLGSKMSDSEYRKSLLQEKIDISTKLQKIITEISFYGINEGLGQTSEISVEEITVLIAESFKELLEIHSTLASIIKVSNLSNIDDRGELFDLVGSTEVVVSSNLSQRVGLKAVLAFILGCMIGTVVVFIRRVIR